MNPDTNTCATASSAVTARWQNPAARLDVVLTELGIATSRNQAQALIKANQVLVDDALIQRVSQKITPGQTVKVLEKQRYVGRAAYKLLAAFTEFNLVAKEKLALDVGASTGGFTQVLLEAGARQVIALDVGSNQLSSLLRADQRVCVVEGFNARELSPQALAQASGVKELPQLIVGDLSFISVTLILQALASITKNETDVCLLFKPQFEVGRQAIKQGIVTDPQAVLTAAQRVVSCAQQQGLSMVGFAASPLQGTYGNQEYLMHFRQNAQAHQAELEKQIKELIVGGR